MSSIGALKRIKRKYKYLIVKEIHRCTRNSNINFGNIEEYWHKENNDDFSQIKEDLEILEKIKEIITLEASYVKTYSRYDREGIINSFEKITEILNIDLQ